LAAMVLGVRVHGDKVENIEVPLDGTFKPVPVPTLLGVPLVYKCLPKKDDGDSRMNVIVRLMSDPEMGLAPMDWQYGGSLGPAPPVLLARKDLLPFSWDDWARLDEYMSMWSEALSEDESPSETFKRYLNPKAFRDHVVRLGQAGFISLHFPIGCTVTPHGLSKAELNGTEGQVVQYSRDRVGVSFSAGEPIALKPERLKLVHEAPLPEQVADAAPEAPNGEVKAAREERVRKQQALDLAKKLRDNVFEDILPADGAEALLFGLGSDSYRKQAVFGAWQHLFKQDLLSEDTLACWLVSNTVQKCFEDQCRRVSGDKSKGQNAYINQLVEAKFHGIDWESMD